MQVHVITGPRASGKTTRLLAIQANLKHQGIDAPILIGANYTTPYFLNLIDSQVLAGVNHFLADDCTQFQIKAVQELAAQGENASVPFNFVVHLVREA